MDQLDPNETPEYLRGPGFEGLSDELAELAEASDTRSLTASERGKLRRGVKQAKKRVLAAKAKRDGKA